MSFDDDPVQVYLREEATIPPLTPEQEAACARHVRAGDQEANEPERIWWKRNWRWSYPSLRDIQIRESTPWT